MRADGRLARCLLADRAGEWLSRSAPKIKRYLNRCSTRQVIDDVSHRRVDDPGRRYRRLNLDGEDCADAPQPLASAPVPSAALPPAAHAERVRRCLALSRFVAGIRSGSAGAGSPRRPPGLDCNRSSIWPSTAFNTSRSVGVSGADCAIVACERSRTGCSTPPIGSSRDAQSILKTPEVIAASEAILNLDAGRLP